MNKVDLIEELTSKSAPKIRKAAVKIAEQKIFGYEKELLDALEILIPKKRSWQAQSQLIRAIGITGSPSAITYLKELALLNFDSTVLYCHLGFSICLLEDIPNNTLNYLKSILPSRQESLLSGACSALLYAKYVPSEKDMVEIMEGIAEIDTNEGQVMTPRCYIAALAYLWPQSITKDFLGKCKQSNWTGLVEMATSSMSGEKPYYVLV